MTTLPVGVVDNDPDHNPHHDAIHRRFNQVVHVSDHGGVGDGVTDDTVAVQDAIDDAESRGALLELGRHRITSTVTVATGGIQIHGDGPNPALILDVDGASALTITGEDVAVRGLGFECQATAVDTKRTGIAINGASRVRVQDCHVKDHISHGIEISGAATDVDIVGGSFTGGLSVDPASSNADVYAQGSALKRIRVIGTTHEPAAADAANIAVFFAAATGFAFDDVIVRDVMIAPGYSRHGIGATDENPDGTYRAGKITVTGCHISGCIHQGIKLKNVQRAIVTDNYIEDCNTTPEGTSLRGGIFLNGNEDVTCTGNMIVDDGTSGIRVEGLGVGTAAGAGRAARTIANNVIKRPAEAGIFLSIRVYDTVVANNIIDDGTQQGIRVDSSGLTGDNLPQRIAINGNTVRDCGAQGIILNGSKAVSVVGNVVSGCTQFGIVAGSSFASDDTTISGNVVVDNDSHGIRAGLGDNISIVGNRSGNTSGSASQTYGASFGASATNTMLIGNDLQGNATASVSGTPTVARANHDYLTEGFFGQPPIGAQGVAGSRGGNAALADLITRLENLGLIIDNTTA